MSHVAEVSLQVKDLDALAEACEQVGLELVRGQRTYKWYGRWMNDWNDGARAAALKGRNPQDFGKCEHAIRLKGTSPGQSYEIGLCARLDGQPGYDLLFDAWGHQGAALEARGGKDMTRLSAEYGAAVAMRRLRREGWRVTRTVDASGKVRVNAKH